MLVLLGKPTDETGFGGASFASAILEGDATAQRGHVQVPDPFLKRVLLEANRAALTWLHEQGSPFGFKDLGAGGIACASSELAAAGGFGMDVDLDQVPTPRADYPPEVTACSETQERFALVIPERLAPRLLKIYNDDYALPSVYEGARAAVVGRVRPDKRYRILRAGQPVCDTTVEVITAGIEHRRPQRPRPARPKPTPLPPVGDHDAFFRRMIGSPSLGSRAPILRYYDTEVQGRMVIRAGEADASVMAPVPGSPLGAALAVDGNPWFVAADPYWGSAHAVCEVLRNLVAVGARPLALTDCLNFGNPEDPEVFDEFVRSVRGLGDAARALGPEGNAGPPIPYVSGNVSFYNESATGRAIEPSPIVAGLGVLEDYAVATTSAIKRAESILVLTGPREARDGASSSGISSRGIPGAICRPSISSGSAGGSTRCSTRCCGGWSSPATTSPRVAWRSRHSRWRWVDSHPRGWASRCRFRGWGRARPRSGSTPRRPGFSARWRRTSSRRFSSCSDRGKSTSR